MNFLLPAAPVSLTHIFLSIFKNNRDTFPIILDPPEKVTAFIPVFNDEEQIRDTISSIMNQTKRPEEIIISDNGSTDNTYQVITRYLKDKGYLLKISSVKTGFFSSYTYINNQLSYPPAIVVKYVAQVSKAESIKRAKKNGLIHHPRTLIVDSDTILHPKFIEEIDRYYYTLKLYKNKAFIVKSNILAATCLPKRNTKTSFQEKIVTMARDIEYAFGHFLIKKGQNHTALYVATGCGFLCLTDLMEMSGKTVADDLELTQRIQSKKTVKRLNSIEELERLLKNKAKIITPQGNKNLDSFLKESSREIYFVDNAATYISSALMFTQDPRNLKNLWRQTYRWNSGFHQVMYLEGKNITRKNKKIMFTLYGALFEGLIGSIYFLILPVFGLYEVFSGYLYFFFKYLLLFYLFDFILQSVFIVISLYQRNLLLGMNKSRVLKNSFVTTIKNLPYFYLLRFINSFQFLYTYLKTKLEVFIFKKRSWASTWSRGL